MTEPLRSFAKEPSTANPSQTLGGSRTKNPNLDSFESVMKAMEVELAKHKKAQVGREASQARKRKDEDISQSEYDAERLMDEELKISLRQESEEEDELGSADVDYNLIKNFLESYKSQAGLSGPVGNLAGRLQPDWKPPRDDSS
jgi:hypothetical protein